MLLSQIGQLATLVPKCQVQCSQNGQTGYDPNDHGIPLTYSYNFTIDQRLPWSMLLDVDRKPDRGGVTYSGYFNFESRDAIDMGPKWSFLAAHVAWPEIGRASCRERGESSLVTV